MRRLRKVGGRLTTCHCKKTVVTKTRTKEKHNFILGKEGTLATESMKLHSQSRKDAGGPTSLLSTRKTFTIGAWNVRTMYETGKASQIAREMRTYKLNILGLSETHWTGTGQLTLSSGEVILFSGHNEEDAIHSQGVAVMLPRETYRALINWEPVSPRIITATFLTKHKDIRMTIIQVYAPTNDADQESKDDFYNRLQDILDHQSAKNITILMGDLNAKIGNQNVGYERVMGKHGLGEMNENGEQLADLCLLNDMIIGGSRFPHKKEHKATWVSPDNATENQIDHMCINRRFRRTIQDVRVKRGADAASDHHLLIGKFRLKLKRHMKIETSTKRYNTELLLNDETMTEYKVKLTNRFQVLQELASEDIADINTLWRGVKEMWNKTCEETLGLKTRKHKEWITAETLRKIKVRKEKKAIKNNSKTRAAKTKAQSEYTLVNTEVKKCIKRDQKKYMDNMTREAEEASAKNNLRELYNITKKLSHRNANGMVNKPIKSKEGKLLTGEEEQLNRWAEHFKEILNRPRPESMLDIPVAEETLDINTEPPSRVEIQQAISEIKKYKAPGPDGITAEEILADTKITTEVFFKLFTKIWEGEIVPMEWKEAHLIKLPKKGNLSECGNYRGISLLSIPSKVFCRILLNRIKSKVDKKLREEQAGFRQGRSCIDQIAALRCIVEQSMEWDSPLIVTFVDYEKAFDSVDRRLLWRLLEHYGIPPKIINLIKAIYDGTSCRVVHSGKLTESFPVNTGVRQGCLLSPFLFLLAIDWIMKMSVDGKRTGIQWTLWKHLEDLDFADDVALLSHIHNQMQEKLASLHENSAQLGLHINIAKTKVLKSNHQQEGPPVTINGDTVEEVDNFCYLGSTIDNTGGAEKDVKARIGKARTSFMLLKNIWKAKTIKLNTKLRIFNTNVKSVLLYGSETWKMTKVIQKKLQTFINNCLRNILGITWKDKIRNEMIWKKTGQEPIEIQIKERKWRWIGHTLRKSENNITKQAMKWNPQGRRRQGRPRNTWRRDVTKELADVKLTWKEAEKMSKDRVKWKALVRGLCTLGNPKGVNKA